MSWGNTSERVEERTLKSGLIRFDGNIEIKRNKESM